MRINSLNYVYSYSRNLQRQNTQNAKINFQGLQKTQDNLSHIKESGFRYEGEVDVVAPDGTPIKGNSYVKDRLASGNSLVFVITDKDNFQLGELSGSYTHDRPNTFISTIRNNTVKTYLEGKGFMDPELPARKSADGAYKGVGRALYSRLEPYLKENYPDINKLFVNAINSDSYDFHCKMGYDGEVGDYDSYSMTNYLEKKLK